MHVKKITKGQGDTIIDFGYPDYLTTVSKSVTYICNNELNNLESCSIVIDVPDETILWSYNVIIPYVATLTFSKGCVYSGGTVLDLYNKDLNANDLLGLSGKYGVTITTPGTIINSTKYGTAAVPSRVVGANFGAGYFVLPRATTFCLTVTSHTDVNNIVTRFTFLEV